jgi:hypothetical protein
MSEIQKIYNNILDGYKYIEKLEINKEIDKEINKEILKDILDDSIYFPKVIRTYIKTHLNKITTYKTIINNRNITLNFYTNNNNTNNNTNNNNNTDNNTDNLHKTLVIIYVLSLYSSGQCSKNLTIHIFLTPFKRMLPKKTTDIISPINVNGGLTFGGCIRTNEIIVYREEEWFKVLIHELFHAFNFDFATLNIDNLKKKIETHTSIPCEYNFYESYCETWARILNVATNININISKTDFLSTFDVLIKTEQLFSLIQCNKILKRIKRLKSPLLYKENSNVICYYVFVGSLMNNYEKFLKWCNNHNDELLNFNKTLNNVDSFLNLILTEYNSSEFAENLTIVDEIELGELKNSLKMTIIT